MMRFRLRFAPSPTGFLHVGGARTALYNYLLARSRGGDFILRMEDTDKSRSTEEAIAAIMEDLIWLGLDWDEGPDKGGPCGSYRQTERLHLYREAVDSLLAQGKAYRCFCEPGQLAQSREKAREGQVTPRYDRRCLGLSDEEVSRLLKEGRPWAARFRVPEGKTVVNDLIRGDIEFDNSTIEDFVMQRRDGTATYNLAVVVDDIYMRITHVLRGDDHLSNTPKQLLLYRALGSEPPQFAHLPMIVGADGKPLSKRHGDVAVGRYREQGFLPDAMINFLALLGWSLDDSTTIISREDLIKHFSLERVSSKPATWDTDKLIWMNQQYIMALPEERLEEEVVFFLERAGLIRGDDSQARETLRRILPLIRERMKLLTDALPLTAFFFQEVSPEIGSLDILRGEQARRMLELSRLKLTSADPFVAPIIEEVLRETASSLNMKPKQAFQPVRVAVTGSRVSPPLFESMEILGKSRCLARLDRALELAEEVNL